MCENKINILGVYDAYNKKWINEETCGTLTSRTGASTTNCGTFEIALPVLTPEREEKRQNGRRFKDNNEDMFTLTAQDRHGVALGVLRSPSEHPGQYVEIYPGTVVYAVWYEKYQCYIAIRKLTPRECFRLQGWTDDYFEKAQFVNSDSQLYKQAGNGVTVNVVEAIAKEL